MEKVLVSGETERKGAPGKIGRVAAINKAGHRIGNCLSEISGKIKDDKKKGYTALAVPALLLAGINPVAGIG